MFVNYIIKMNNYFFLIILILIVHINAIQYHDCGHKEVIKLETSNCPAESCIIHKGKSFNLAGDFVSNQDSNQLEIEITAKVDGVEIPVPGVERDGCNHVKCPLVKGQTYHFNYDIIIARFMPNAKANVTARLVGEQGTMVACINFNAQVQD